MSFSPKDHKINTSIRLLTFPISLGPLLWCYAIRAWKWTLLGIIESICQRTSAGRFPLTSAYYKHPIDHSQCPSAVVRSVFQIENDWSAQDARLTFCPFLTPHCDLLSRSLFSIPLSEVLNGKDKNGRSFCAFAGDTWLIIYMNMYNVHWLTIFSKNMQNDMENENSVNKGHNEIKKGNEY